MIEINRNPSSRELLVFGGLFALFFGIVGGLLFWKFGQPGVARIIWIAAGVVVVVFAVAPPVRRPLYLGWMYAAYPIGWVVTHALLALIYYLLFTSIGVVMRLLGRDPLERRPDPEARSYWVEHRPGGEPDRYFRQF